MSDKSFDYWEFFAAECERAGAPLYVRIVRGICGDAEIKALAARCKAGQPPANILLAAVHFLLLRGAQHPLRRFYPSLNGGHRVEGEDPFPHFRDFVGAHRGELMPLIESGVTNTNEVARCSALHAGFRTIAAEAGEPLNLIEIGPSAGLNLNWDRYRIRYLRNGEAFESGPPDAALLIDCELRGSNVPPHGSSPKVASRVGLELNPVDLSDPYWRDWLKALIFPDHVARFARLEQAIELFRHRPAEIRAGDALANLADAIARLPEDQPVVVYHSFVIYQFSEEMREALDNILTMAGLGRTVWRLSLEGSLAGENTLSLGRYHDGSKAVRPLARAHAHGTWLEWL
jgi:hypothetical protein